ncbi:hypothetical protein AGRA3207_007483 [Actinomadura graeca]|uniref:Uncharacterized protein n=1 Tax=Actinomadura graeca TaxID=2750812 RepID=A0ABX8R6M7_9ACTN|nr:hypothetical protein [Actinomadura graeca]QXJ25914.1 hypothetical protein AGRA3207_007483 [Actinomadura graeca]
MATVAGPHPPRSHDPLASDQDVYVTALSATGQSVRQVPFDTAEQHASGADPYGLLTYRMLRPPAGVRSNTLLMVQAAPAAAADLHTDMQERLRLTQHRDARLLAGNQQIRERLLQQQRREQAGRSRSTTGSAPSPTPPAADAPRAQPAPQPADKARHRPDAAEPGHHQRRQ